MTVSSLRGRRTKSEQRRSRRPVFGSPQVSCAVTGCQEAAGVRCPRCERAICHRHSDNRTPPPARETRAGHRARPEIGNRAGTAPVAMQVRCALCRLDDRRRGQASMRRMWWGVTAAGFAVFAAVAIRNNPLQGVALLALAAVILGVAMIYDRLLRRR